jgi:hypothetical protein
MAMSASRHLSQVDARINELSSNGFMSLAGVDDDAGTGELMASLKGMHRSERTRSAAVSLPFQDNAKSGSFSH